MTNLQLLLTIGIPSLLIVLSWITNNSRFDRIEKRLDLHDTRFNDLQTASDTRFSALQSASDTRFSALQSASHRDALEILRSMTALHERVAVVETKQNS
jgi:hypothetical protein